MVQPFDEMRDADGTVRPAYRQLGEWLDSVPREVLQYRRTEAEFIFRRMGITFAVYGDPDAQERLIPFDIVPRIITRTEWAKLSRGLDQRLTAINAFQRDI